MGIRKPKNGKKWTVEEINDLKRRAGLPPVTYISEDDDPEVLVNGVGRYRLSSLKRNVMLKLEDLNKTAKRAVKSNAALDWENVQYMINHAAMKEMIKTIVEATKELEDNEDDRY